MVKFNLYNIVNILVKYEFYCVYRCLNLCLVWGIFVLVPHNNFIFVKGKKKRNRKADGGEIVRKGMEAKRQEIIFLRILILALSS